MGRYCVKKVIHFCYGHRLLEYAGKCRHLHGHNGMLEIEVAADGLDHRGMVMDFGDIKALAKAWVDSNLDHCMLLRRDDPAAGLLQELGEPVFLMDDNPTAENIAKLIYRELRGLGLPVARVTLWETVSGSASYDEG